jgi:hypothetical protein
MTFVAQDFREQLPNAHFIINYENVCHVSLAPSLIFIALYAGILYLSARQ